MNEGKENCNKEGKDGCTYNVGWYINGHWYCANHWKVIPIIDGGK